MSVIFIALLVADVCWHIWEYKERKRLDKCWVNLFKSDQLCIRFFRDIAKTKETTNDK